MPAITILHTNDIHGRIEGLARVATLVERTRAAQPATPLLYVDAGDSEETSVRLSNLTKGTAMHHLLSAAGCAAATVGNAAPLRYGHQVLADHAAAARYPLLLANLRLPGGAPVPGVQLTHMVAAGGMRLGLLGITTDMEGEYEREFELKTPAVLPLVRELAAALRQDGADAIVLLSHLGLAADRALAAELQGALDVIIGAHTHDLLPSGEQIGSVLVAQAGEYAQHIGRIDLEYDGERLSVRASVLPVPGDTPPAPAVLAAAAEQEAQVAQFLSEVIGELAAPLDFATDRECGVGNLLADALRERMQADLALVAAGQAFSMALPGGPLTRLALWDACPSSANPAVVSLTGAQLVELLRRGLDLAFAAERPRMLRGQARGLFHLSGATFHNGQLLIGGQPVDPAREYLVAGSDWEFAHYGGYAAAEWRLQPRYDMPIILREAIEQYLAVHRPAHVPLGRLGAAWNALDEQP
ncbi:MAG: bifunctional UDP-sugar hydrolase/5'-nucleotidase [Kouleothrix sp.]|jgi:2',3'-cyclic-nucleotide 2'-phosphodiesterase (5'-nucleotidase family)|nr:bifunctional metallophosphatase/5'-nucleotidase [Kouleothrix sp.]